MNPLQPPPQPQPPPPPPRPFGIPVLALVLVGTVAVLAGLAAPLFQLPLVGELRFRQLHGCGPVQAWLAGSLLTAGAVLLAARRWPKTAAACGLAGVALVAVSLARFALWLRSRLGELAEAGLLPQGAPGPEILPGGWALIGGLGLAFFCWTGIVCLLLRRARVQRPRLAAASDPSLPESAPLP